MVRGDALLHSHRMMRLEWFYFLDCGHSLWIDPRIKCEGDDEREGAFSITSHLPPITHHK